MDVFALAVAVAWQTAAPHVVAPGMSLDQATLLLGEAPQMACRQLMQEHRLGQFPRARLSFVVTIGSPRECGRLVYVWRDAPQHPQDVAPPAAGPSRRPK